MRHQAVAGSSVDEASGSSRLKQAVVGSVLILGHQGTVGPALLLPPPPRLLAESCWSTDPLLRPSASTLVNKLKELLVAVEASVGSRRPQATADGLAALGMERGLRAF